MKNKLFGRFLLIIGTIALAILCLYKFPLKPGIDLGGGTSLLYEVDIPQGYQGNPSELAKQVIDTLKSRIDPLGQKNLVWRVVGGRRIQLQIPLASKAGQAARKGLRDAEEALSKSAITPQDVVDASKLTGAAREEFIKTKAMGWDAREKKLRELAALQEDLDAAEKAMEADAKNVKRDAGYSFDLQERIWKNKRAKQEGEAQLYAMNVDVDKVRTLLEARGQKSADESLKQIQGTQVAQAELLKKYIAAYDFLAEYRDQESDDPDEIKRLLQATGKLDFRICVSPNDSLVDVGQARRQLDEVGPRKPVGNNAKWFLIDPKMLDNFKGTPVVVKEWGEKQYVLLFTDPLHALSHDFAGRPWKLTNARPTTDSNTGQMAVSFAFDAAGTPMFGALTTYNKGRQMAIVLDDKAMQAPNINEPITTGNGQITMGRKSSGLEEDVNNLVKILNAGSLAAALGSEPISELQIQPQMGASNIQAGKNSAIYAIIAVMGFMVIYYTITGMFANLALVINLVITLAVMVVLGATFTLPGIAGIVLTLGMAVDANVLINERIREEVHKGGSLWMAVKQGYDRVFWTIFDANLTTSLTSIVLILVGSEEVRGFGVTLLIGLIIHMFTALFVTRTLMIAAIRWGILKHIDDHSVAEYIKEVFTFTWLRGRWPFMRVIHVSNIDWIGKRWYFWIFSGVITIIGLLAFIARGDDKYDTEFRGGTQVTFTTPTEQTDAQVRAKIKEIADDKELLAKYPEFSELGEPTVYAVGATNKLFELQTSIADTTDRKIKQPFLEALAEKFPDEQAVVKLSVANVGNEGGVKLAEDDVLRKLADLGHMVEITNGELSRNFKKVSGIPPEQVHDFTGGVAIYLNGINPPQTLDALESRLKTAKLSLASTSRASNVVGVRQAEGKPGFYDSVVIVSRDQQIVFDAQNPNNGFDLVKEQELHAVLVSLEPRSPFVAVNSIDAVVAGQAKTQAILAIIFSLVLIVAYVWIRFGGIRYGFGAILSLAHDAIMALAATVLAKYVYETAFGRALLINDFKINLTMIAAYLTIIGYSVNDTIVIFDRIRENRGHDKNAPLSAKLINDSINQCFGRTIWTTFTVFIVVLIMYIFGGEGVRGFSFAMLVGTITGAYSTLAIASPMLLGIKGLNEAKKPTEIVVRRKDETVVEG